MDGVRVGSVNTLDNRPCHARAVMCELRAISYQYSSMIPVPAEGARGETRVCGRVEIQAELLWGIGGQVRLTMPGIRIGIVSLAFGSWSLPYGPGRVCIGGNL